MEKLALVIPVYNEEKGLYGHIREIDRILKADGLDFRFMLVNDGSKDGTWKVVENLAREMDNVSGVSFSRNFGKESAICAGLASIDAERYLVMDSDLQHPPRFIKGMMEKMDETGADIIDGVKTFRGNESLKSRVLAKGFYGTLKALTGLELDNSSDFKLMRKCVIDELRKMPEGDRFFRAMVDFVGFDRVEFPFSVDDRDDGGSRFSTKRLLKMAISAIITNSAAPLYLSFAGGFAALVAAVIDLVVMIVRGATDRSVSGTMWTVLAVFLCTAVILATIGIMGAYVTRIYDEVRGRTRYIISKRI